MVCFLDVELSPARAESRRHTQVALSVAGVVVFGGIELDVEVVEPVGKQSGFLAISVIF